MSAIFFNVGRMSCWFLIYLFQIKIRFRYSNFEIRSVVHALDAIRQTKRNNFFRQTGKYFVVVRFVVIFGWFIWLFWGAQSFEVEWIWFGKSESFCRIFSWIFSAFGRVSGAHCWEQIDCAKIMLISVMWTASATLECNTLFPFASNGNNPFENKKRSAWSELHFSQIE